MHTILMLCYDMIWYTILRHTKHDILFCGAAGWLAGRRFSTARERVANTARELPIGRGQGWKKVWNIGWTRFAAQRITRLWLKGKMMGNGYPPFSFCWWGRSGMRYVESVDRNVEDRRGARIERIVGWVERVYRNRSEAARRSWDLRTWDLPLRHVVLWHRTIFTWASLLKGGCPLRHSFAHLLFVSNIILYWSTTHRVSHSQDNNKQTFFGTVARLRDSVVNPRQGKLLSHAVAICYICQSTIS